MSTPLPITPSQIRFMVATVLAGLRYGPELTPDEQEAERENAIAELGLIAPRDAHEAIIAAQMVLYNHHALDAVRCLVQPAVTQEMRTQLQRNAMALSRSADRMSRMLDRYRNQSRPWAMEETTEAPSSTAAVPATATATPDEAAPRPPAQPIRHAHTADPSREGARSRTPEPIAAPVPAGSAAAAIPSLEDLAARVSAAVSAITAGAPAIPPLPLPSERGWTSRQDLLGSVAQLALEPTLP